MLKGRKDRAEKGLRKCGTVMRRKVHTGVKNRVSEKSPYDGRTKKGGKEGRIEGRMDTKFRGYSESLHAIHNEKGKKK